MPQAEMGDAASNASDRHSANAIARRIFISHKRRARTLPDSRRTTRGKTSYPPTLCDASLSGGLNPFW
jgi:hypothetical protein